MPSKAAGIVEHDAEFLVLKLASRFEILEINSG